MVLQSTGLISFANIASEFNLTGDISMSELYSGSAIIGDVAGIPSSGLIRVSNFYDKAAIASDTSYSEGQKYPPGVMNTNTKVFSGLSYGNGTYIASGYTPIYGTNNFFYAFDNSPSTNYSPNASFVNGVWNGVSTTFTGSGTYNGSWISLSLPFKIKVASIGITPQAVSSNAPKTLYLLGSNDGSTWTTISTFSNLTYDPAGANASLPKVLTINATVEYKYYTLVWTQIQSSSGTYLARLADFYLMT